VTPAPVAAEITHTNRLAQEKSPYLLQHAHNPVDWYSWGEEAFARARRENKPIFLSIGYSTCHWCHVMAHESFEDQATAAIMNREFVNIKVDREERPDVDRVYMMFVQATTGGGGWPMSVWLTPDLKPFVGGTYFPPEDRYGQPAFKKVLERIAAAWKENHEKIAEQGEKIVAAIRESQASQTATEGKIDNRVFQEAFEQLNRNYDPREGGFSVAPKFPRPVTLNFLTRFYARDPKSDAGKQALEMVLFTLRKMAAGGMHDHVGGGFHRYSVDRYWHVPHFEKMLYDQAQLASSYLDMSKILGDPYLSSLPGQGEADARAPVRVEFEAVARDILDYIARDMTSKEGGFFSAEDADSVVPVAAVYDRRAELDPQVSDAHPPSVAAAISGAAGRAPLQKNAEGAFYVWTEKEIDDGLGDSAKIFKYFYGVQPHGNAPEGSDPQDEFRGKNILIERHTVAETARHFEKSEDDVGQSLARSREKLLSIRGKRPRPHLDDKIIAAWNGLMISAYARGAQVLHEPRYLESATRAAIFLRANLYDGKNKLLYRSYRNGRGGIEGFADDYAFVIQGMFDLYEASFDVEWLKFAVELQEAQDRLFFDEKGGGYFSTSGKDKSVVLRMKDDNDSAEPAASSVSALNLLRLAQMTNRGEWRKRGQKTIEAFSPTLSHFASAMPQMLVALNFTLSKPRQIVITGEIENPKTKALINEVHRHFLPTTILLLADGAAGQKYLGEKNKAIRAMTPIDGNPAAYVCENFTCKAPVTDSTALRKLLSE
jgi:uncharacterized protein YyaL (SSP411 family)